MALKIQNGITECYLFKNKTISSTANRKNSNPFYVFEILGILLVRKYPESRKVFSTFDDVFYPKASKIFLCVFNI